MNLTHDPPVVNITGERVAIGPLQRDLIDTYLRWFNDMRVARTLHHPRQITHAELIASFDAVTRDESVESL